MACGYCGTARTLRVRSRHAGAAAACAIMCKRLQMLPATGDAARVRAVARTAGLSGSTRLPLAQPLQARAHARSGRAAEWLESLVSSPRPLSDGTAICGRKMFSTAQKTQELWMWKMEYLHHEQRPLYFGEWF